MAQQTPKEKAKEFFDKYQLAGSQWYVDRTKNYALIAVDEIINSTPLDPTDVDWDDCGGTHQYWYQAQKKEALEFWKEVKKEIEKL